ncbi:hypothetical protein D9757_008436 [Collybiopsis confluens]|uniref:Uncharacterized protein n=1 Tax=Collybiopsis confluens TaxID=2823264 RepID=A0A8H5LHE9_9AGAR|nr:hypothetical protein D9757_013053 [Collybiopsis confluens]KAF5383341.1 hypothetical protein D9757_008436 [Collybiopsis confluens]
MELMQDSQKMKMKKTDGRIQMVTETMSVLRMVKFFGWERMMNDRIKDAREQELTFIRRLRLLDVHYKRNKQTSLKWANICHSGSPYALPLEPMDLDAFLAESGLQQDVELGIRSQALNILFWLAPPLYSVYDDNFDGQNGLTYYYLVHPCPGFGHTFYSSPDVSTGRVVGHSVISTPSSSLSAYGSAQISARTPYVNYDVDYQRNILGSKSSSS